MIHLEGTPLRSDGEVSVRGMQANLAVSPKWRESPRDADRLVSKRHQVATGSLFCPVIDAMTPPAEGADRTPRVIVSERGKPAALPRGKGAVRCTDGTAGKG